MNSKHKLTPPLWKTIALLAPFVISLAFSFDMYVPAIPRLAESMQTTPAMLQLTISLFMVAAGLFQLIVGPLSDHFGRHPIAIVSILIFIVGTTLCALSNGIFILIISRIVQSLGACGMLVIAMAMIRDLFEGRTLGQAYSYLNGAMSFSPIMAPSIGAFLDIQFGWRSIFVSLLILPLVSLIFLGSTLKETLPKDNRIPFSFKVFKTYRRIAKNEIFIWYTLFSATGLLLLILFFSLSPYLLMTHLKVSEAEFGILFAVMGVSFFLGSFLCGWITGKIGIFRTMQVGFVISLVGGVIMITRFYFEGLTILGFVGPMAIIGIGATFCLGAGSGGAMEPFPNESGAAAALGGALRFLFPAAIVSLLVNDRVSSLLPLAIPTIAVSAAGLIVFALRRKSLDLELTRLKDL